MAQWTTYHSVVDTVDGWLDTANAVDNNIATFATNEVLGMKTLILDTPAAVSATGAITKVEHRFYGSLSDLGIPCKLRLFPRFIAGDGDVEDVTQLLGWSAWFDITGDTNAPGAWAWSDVEALGANIQYWWGSGPVPLAQCAVVEVRVTYESDLAEKDTVSRNYYY